MDVNFHILLKERPTAWKHVVQLLLCTLSSVALHPDHISPSRHLSSVHWLCSFVCDPLSFVCSLHLSKCLLCPLSHVHLLVLVKSVSSVGVSGEEQKATICLFGRKLLQLDTNQTPGLSSRIALHLFKVVAISLPQRSTDLSGPGPTITAV